MGNILFISDRLEKIQQYTNIFNRKPYNFTVVSDENVILETAELNSPDVIILDYKFNNIKKNIKNLKSIYNSTAFVL